MNDANINIACFFGKAYWVLLVSVMTTGVQAQDELPPLELADWSDSTGFGTPVGEKVSKEIGPSGGAVSSRDGMVELIFPPGAVNSFTTVSIQAANNLAPNGLGTAYKFEPEGAKFEKPVQIRFRYTDEDVAACPAELMSLASQDNSGKWNFLDFDDYDSATKVLTGEIEHFSYYSKLADLKLVPFTASEKAEIRVNDHFWFWLRDVRRRKYMPRNSTDTWFVNGMLQGNATVGYAIAKSMGGDEHGTYSKWAIYYAPANLPRAAINVQVEVSVYLNKNDQLQATRKIFSCKVDIVDEYEISFHGVWNNLAAGQTTAELVDTAFLCVQLRTSGSRATEIKNSLFVATKRNCQTGCQCEYVNEATCTGPIQIAGLRAVALEGSTSSYTVASLHFTPVPAGFPFIRTTCPKARHTPSMSPPGMPALPMQLKFDMLDGEQKQELDSGLSFAKYTITIRRVPPRPRPTKSE